MHFTFCPKYSFFVLPSNIFGIKWIEKILDLLASLPATLHYVSSVLYGVLCQFWLETANQVAVIGNTWSDATENITIIVH